LLSIIAEADVIASDKCIK